MNKTIRDLIEQREQTRDSYNRANAELQAKLQTELNKKFDKSTELKKAVADLENSTEYTSDECGEISRYILFTIPSAFKPFPNELREYLSESYSVYLNTGTSPGEHTALQMFEGECIVVNEDGDVFEGHKCIIDAKNAKTEDGEYSWKTMKTLIEEHMNKTGCFPAVLRQDRYGSLYPIITQQDGE